MKKLSSFLTLVLIFSILAVPVQAKNIEISGTPYAQVGESAFKLESVDYSLGYRSVDVGGSQAAYDSDVNLNDGLSLFDFNVTLVPGNKKVDNYLDVAKFNLGDVGDPTSTYEVQAKEYGLYDFGVKRSKRDYVYDNEYAKDYHSYDFTRTQDSMHLTVTPEGLPKFFIDKDQLDREGMSVLTRHVANDSFAKVPINEISGDTTVGTEFTYAGFDVYLAHTQDNYDGVVDVEEVNPIGTVNTSTDSYTKSYKSDEVRTLNRQIDNLAVHKVVSNRLDVTLNVEDARGEGKVDASTTHKLQAAYEAGHDPTTLYSDAGLTTKVGYAWKDEAIAKEYSGTSESSSFKGSLDATYAVNSNTYLHSGYKATETEYSLDYQTSEVVASDYRSAYEGNTYYYNDADDHDDDGNLVESVAITDKNEANIKDFNETTTNEKDKFYITGEHYFNNNLKVELGYLNNATTVYENGVKDDEMTSDGYKVGTIYEPTNNIKVDVEYEGLSNEENSEKISDDKKVDVNVEWELANNLTLSGKYKKDNEEGKIGPYLHSIHGHADGERVSENTTFSIAYQPISDLSLDMSYSNNIYEFASNDGTSDYATKMDNNIYSLNTIYQVNDQLSAKVYSTYVDGKETIDAGEPFNNEYKDYGVNLTKAIANNIDVSLDYRSVEYDEQDTTTSLHGTNANDYSADIITLGLEGGF